MTVPQGNVRFFCNVGRIRSSVPLHPTFEDDETWYCGTAIAVPYRKLHKVLVLQVTTSDFVIMAPSNLYHRTRGDGVQPISQDGFQDLILLLSRTVAGVENGVVFRHGLAVGAEPV